MWMIKCKLCKCKCRYNAIDDDGTQSMLILLIWSLGILTILSKMANHQEAIAELTIT